jgi:murein DD-endopeptidase MepM/ murein hydrolase activator NlpD
MIRPVPDKLSQRFGANPAAYKKFGIKGHDGIDFASPRGREVRACDSGSVAYSKDDPKGYGQVVKLKHAWGESVYAHLQKCLVQSGKVRLGQVIGTVDSTGNSTGNHLHFGIRRNPINNNNGYFGWIDPLPYMEEEMIDNVKLQAQKVLADLRPQGWKNSWGVILKGNWTLKHFIDWLSRAVTPEKRKDIDALKAKIAALEAEIKKLKG